MNKLKKSLGFTLTELVVTTAMMGTLAAVSVPSFIETQAKAKSTKTMSNISEIGSKLGQVYNELSGEYGEIDLIGNTDPSSSSIVASAQEILSESNTDNTEEAPFNFRNWGNIYENLPTSPFGDMPYQYYISGPGDVTYYTDNQGNVTVTVIPWQIVIFDQESPPVLEVGTEGAEGYVSPVQGLSMEFSY
ncbi:MAG: hypothetical protein IIB44_09315 [Candidatus Marinimicrobia bacterium]|nr:hypothetical protein [Candidatus Neomarinimicrobiota bacterium]